MSKLFPQGIKTVGFLLGLLVMTMFLSRAFTSPVSEIESWHGFMQLPKNTLDVLVVGNSHAECTLAPMQIWQKTGVTTYILKSGGINTRHKLACVETALQSQKPKVVAIEIYSIALDTKTDHEHNYGIYGHMPWSLSKISSVIDTAEATQTAQYLFPISIHHSRWKELDKVSFINGLTGASGVPVTGGAHILVERPEPVSAESKPSVKIKISDEKFLEEMGYLKRMASAAQADGAQVLFFQSPVQNPEMFAFYGRVKTYFAKENPQIKFLNMSDYVSQMGLTQEDFRDEGHLYLWGMKKATDWWISNIQSTWHLQSRRGTPVQKWWDKNALWWEQNTQIFSPVTQ